MNAESMAPGVVEFASLDEPQLVALAVALAPVIISGGAIHLCGELGAGKTTFARALLVALGVGERIKSPTYSLIESYRVDALDIQHLDLYRLADGAELEYLGLADLGDDALFLIEWPERGAGRLPAPDLTLALSHRGSCRTLRASATTAAGSAWLRAWSGWPIAGDG